jgi:hypothetical protein
MSRARSSHDVSVSPHAIAHNKRTRLHDSSPRSNAAAISGSASSRAATNAKLCNSRPEIPSRSRA